MYGPPSGGTPTSSSSAARPQQPNNNNNDQQQPHFGGSNMSSLAKPATTHAPSSTTATPARTDDIPTNFASATRLRLNMPTNLTLPGHNKPTEVASGGGATAITVGNNRPESTKLFDTIVIPPVHAPNTFQDVAANIREKLHIPAHFGWRAMQAAIAEKQAKRKKKAAKKGPKLPFKQMLKEAALRQYRRWFKPAELVFYLGQRENAAFPFNLDENKQTYTYEWRTLFHVYAGIFGIILGLGWWIITTSPQTPNAPNENFDTLVLGAFLPWILMLLSLWIIIAEIVPHRIVIDTTDHTVHLYHYGMHSCAARYETSFVRLRRALGSADSLRFNLVFGARNFPECFISNTTKNARVLRTLGRNLAKHLHVNYFDFNDLSIYHIPRMPHFVADSEWTQEMLCLLQVMKQRQQELDEVRYGPPVPTSPALNPSGCVSPNVNNLTAFPSSSVCLNIHAPHVEPETVVDTERASSQAALGTNVDELPVTVIGGEPVVAGRTSLKHRPQALSQPRHIATSIKRPTNFSHPLLPSDALSRPTVKDSLESLSKVMLSSPTPSKAVTSAADIEQQPITTTNLDGKDNKSTVAVVDEKKEKKKSGIPLTSWSSARRTKSEFVSDRSCVHISAYYPIAIN